MVETPFLYVSCCNQPVRLASFGNQKMQKPENLQESTISLCHGRFHPVPLGIMEQVSQIM